MATTRQNLEALNISRGQADKAVLQSRTLNLWAVLAEIGITHRGANRSNFPVYADGRYLGMTCVADLWDWIDTLRGLDTDPFAPFNQ